MNRKNFIKTAGLVGLSGVVAAPNAFAENLLSNSIDKLVDSNGNFIQQALPYSESYLEPYMDAETLHLHYTYHHGGATKAANTDLKKNPRSYGC